MNIGPYQIHPACAAVPEMAPDEYSDLLAGMKRSGYDANFPVIIHMGDVVDGRNRLKAALELGITPVFEAWKPTRPDEEVWEFVLRASCRRNLTVGQRAVLAVQVMPKIEPVATARMQAGKSDPGTTLVPGSEHRRDHNKRSAAMAAKAVGVGRQSVEIVKRVSIEAPEKLAQISAGTLSIADAKRQLDHPTIPPAPPDAKTDQCGRVIEDPTVKQAFYLAHMLGKFERELRSLVKSAREEVAPSILGRNFRLDQFEQHISNAIRVTKFAKPYAVCPLMPSCKVGGCKHCHGDGFVPKDVFDHMPSELKA